ASEVVPHAGRQDVAILRRAWGTEITNLFDTQLAAGFVGASAQTGYGNLLGTMLGRRVGKTASYTRWDARPLTAEQLSYAAEDVAHLLELADELQRRLRETSRLEWAREECRRLESATDERDPDTAWERLPRMGPRGGPRRAAEPARRAARPIRSRGCADDRARRGTPPCARAGGGARLRADRLAQRARADRRRGAPRRARARRAHACRLAARAGR